MNDYYFFRFMHALVGAEAPDELARLHGIAALLPEADVDREELLLRLSERCQLLGMPVPPPRPPERLDWEVLFPPISTGIVNLDADPWNADWLRYHLPPELRTLKGVRRRDPSEEELLRFRALPIYARNRARYPWLRGLPLPLCPPDPVVRRFRLAEEDDAVYEMEVTACGHGNYRAENGLASIEYLGDDDLGYGALVLAEELPDGTLLYHGITADPRLDVVCRTVPEPFIRSVEFEAYTDGIMAAGGNWELWFMSLFSAYRPRPAGTPADVNALEQSLDEAKAMWERGGRKSRPGYPWPLERAGVKIYRRKE
jgi:hypothetical protein